MKHWWRAGDPPYPSKAAIAEAIGVSPRTVQRRLTYMEELKLIERRKRPGPLGTNAIVFDGLVRELEPYAEEMVAERERRKQGKREQQRRRRPRAKGAR